MNDSVTKLARNSMSGDHVSVSAASDRTRCGRGGLASKRAIRPETSSRMLAGVITAKPSPAATSSLVTDSELQGLSDLG